MRPIPSLKITLEIPIQRAHGTGLFSSLVFDTGSAPDFCVIAENERRTNGAKSAPFHSGAYTQPRTAQDAPFSLPNGARMEFEAWVPTAPLQKIDAEKEPKNTPQEDLLLAREIRAGFAADLAHLDEKLFPVRLEERQVKDRVLATHGERDGVVILNTDRAGERAPLFEQLSQISREWGPVKTERNNLYRQIKALDRDIDRLQKIITAEDRKKRKA